MKLILVGLLVVLADPAWAQSKPAPTFYAASQGLVPLAAGATDVFCLQNTIGVFAQVVRVGLFGTASTPTTVPVSLVKRSAADTGGTLATGAALPSATAADSTAAIARGVPRAWTANPTALGSAIGIMAVISWAISTAGSTPDNSGFILARLGDFDHSAVVLRGNEALCINFNSTAITGGVLNVNMRWTEN